MANGHPLIDYEVVVQRADMGEKEHISEGIKTTSYEVTGLLPATSYSVKVRARAKIGYGPLSAAITAVTEAATRAPDVPFSAPKPHDGIQQHDCTSIELKLPALRSGCGGDEWLTIEMSDGGAWLPAVEGAKGKTAVVSSLDPYVAYRFRVSAANTAGVSPVGAEGNPAITDADHSKIGEPPTVVPTSSASITVSWASSPCRPQLTWEVLYAHHDGAAASSLKWQTLAKSVTGSTFEVQSLRCPSGCVFRVRPLELRGLADEYSKPSALVRTKTLPRSPSGAKRIEMRLTSEVPADRAGALANHLAADLASALEVAKSRVDVVEVRRQGLFFIFDLLAADDGLTTEELSHILAGQVNDPKSALFSGSVTKDVDPSAQPQLILSEGSVESLEAPFTVTGLAARITFVIAVGAALIAVSCVCARALCRSEEVTTTPSKKKAPKKKTKGRRTGGGQYGQIGQQDDFSSDDDVIEQEAQRLGSRR